MVNDNNLEVYIPDSMLTFLKGHGLASRFKRVSCEDFIQLGHMRLLENHAHWLENHPDTEPSCRFVASKLFGFAYNTRMMKSSAVKILRDRDKFLRILAEVIDENYDYATFLNSFLRDMRCPSYVGNHQIEFKYKGEFPWLPCNRKTAGVRAFIMNSYPLYDGICNSFFEKLYDSLDNDTPKQLLLF